MSTWAIWAVMLVLQNASYTWVSRARNSRNIGYHALAAVFSNGIFIASMYFAVDKIRTATTLSERAAVIAFYTVFTVIGSVFMHWFAMRYMERGSRRVGS